MLPNLYRQPEWSRSGGVVEVDRGNAPWYRQSKQLRVVAVHRLVHGSLLSEDQRVMVLNRYLLSYKKPGRTQKTMGKLNVYDKASWHYPEGAGCPSLNAALIHLNVVHNWLGKNNLLTTEAKEITPNKMGEDYSLTSEDVSELGNKVLTKCYDKWLEKIDYKNKPNTKILDNCLKSTK